MTLMPSWLVSLILVIIEILLYTTMQTFSLAKIKHAERIERTEDF